MTYIVTENCIKCKYTDCVDVCPVIVSREGPNMLVIDPEECIDCICVARCPVDAIYSEDDLPDDQKDFLEINARLSKLAITIKLMRLKTLMIGKIKDKKQHLPDKFF